MLRKAIVHIGPMKTGSTSIQHWLFQQNEALAKKGFHVAKALGRNMSRLSAFAQAGAIGATLAKSDAEKISQLRQEIAALPPSAHTLVFSGEMLGQLLNQQAEIDALKKFLDEFFDRYTIVVYLRRQDELSVSRYSTVLRRGEKRARPLAAPLDYEMILSIWSKTFGAENVKARVFDRAAMVDGDVVHDFARTAGLPHTPTTGGPIDHNPSLLPAAQQFLLNLAEQVREADFAKTFVEINGHDLINRVLNSGFKGPGTKPARADAIAYYDQVRDSNERVRKAWFPDREKLFGEDFSGYPEKADQPVKPEKLLEVAMATLTALVTARSLSNNPGPVAMPNKRGPQGQARKGANPNKAGGPANKPGGGPKRPAGKIIIAKPRPDKPGG